MILVVTMLFGIVACSQEEKNKTSGDLGLETAKEITIWYNNSKYMDYLKYVAEELHNTNEKLTVNIQYIEDKDYFTKIYDASMREGTGPDIFIADSSELEKICTMGLAAQNNVYADNYTAQTYCSNAIEAATYNNKLYGYPLDFNVAFMAYNSVHAYYISTFKQLDEYIAHFESTEDNEAIKQLVNWDVSDMFLNYAFASGCVEIGGANGDDSTLVKVNDATLVQVLEEYLRFRDEYGIVTSEAGKLECSESFNSGNVSYTIMDMQYFRKLIDSDVKFHVSEIPALTDELKTNTLSETALALVSPYASDVQVAKAVANALSYEYAGKFYEKTGWLSSRNMSYEGELAEDYKKIYDIYTNSVIKAQFRGAASMYAYYEILLNQVYQGEDIVTSVASFANKLKPREVQKETQASTQ